MGNLNDQVLKPSLSETVYQLKPRQTFSVIVANGLSFYHYLFVIVDRATNLVRLSINEDAETNGCRPFEDCRSKSQDGS